MEINLRINKLIEELGYNKSSFAAKVGVSQPIITHITNGRNNPGLEVIQKILSNIPEINPDWLIMGRGEMLLNNYLKQKMISDINSDVNNSLIKLEEEVKFLRNKVEILNSLLVENREGE